MCSCGFKKWKASLHLIPQVVAWRSMQAATTPSNLQEQTNDDIPCSLDDINPHYNIHFNIKITLVVCCCAALGGFVVCSIFTALAAYEKEVGFICTAATAFIGMLWGASCTFLLLKRMYVVCKIRKLAQTGDAKALNELADILMTKDQIVTKDKKLGVHLLIRNVEEHSDLAACKTLLEYDCPEEIEPSAKEKCMVLIAEHGDFECCVELVKEKYSANREDRVKWLKKALEIREEPQLLIELAEYSIQRLDFVTANSYYLQAAQSGKTFSAQAKILLAENYLHGLGGKDTDAAVKLLHQAADSTEPCRCRALSKLGQLYFKGKVVPRDIEMCIDCYRRILKIRPTDPKASYALAHLIIDGYSQESLKHARSLLKTAANKGLPEAVFELAQAYEHGTVGSKKCARKAIRLYHGKFKKNHRIYFHECSQVMVAEKRIKKLTKLTAKQDIVIAFLLGHSSRAGANSPLLLLPPSLLHDIANIIWKMLFV